MNNELQTPISLDDVVSINQTAVGYKVALLQHYPTDYRHLKVNFIDVAVPFRITRNEDPFWWFDKKAKKQCTNTQNMWVVVPTGDAVNDVPIKQFKTVQAAVDYAISEYEKYLQGELNKLKALKKSGLTG